LRSNTTHAAQKFSRGPMHTGALLHSWQCVKPGSTYFALSS